MQIREGGGRGRLRAEGHLEFLGARGHQRCSLEVVVPVSGHAAEGIDWMASLATNAMRPRLAG